jgi:formamidopyrimidine-DNA glycosylase
MVLGLRSALMGRVLERVRIVEKGVLHRCSPRLLRGLKGCRLVGLTREGKFLLFHLSNGARLVFHLKMTGRLAFREQTAAPLRWERLTMEFAGMERRVSFQDQRKFGYMAVIPEGEECSVPLICELGPDALRVSRQELKEILRASRRPVKTLLLDQRAIAGLGNIYVDESLHRARVHPLCPAAEVTGEETGRLHRAMRNILTRAIKCGGSTVRSFSDSRGIQGTFQKYHRVYGRRGEICRRCGSLIAYARIASRGTHYCSGCQKMPSRKRGRRSQRRS